MRSPDSLLTVFLTGLVLVVHWEGSYALADSGTCIDELSMAEDGEGINVFPESQCSPVASTGEPIEADSDVHLGFPVFLNTPTNGQSYTPTLFDVDDDGSEEIFVTGGHAFGLEGDGTFLPGWPIEEQGSMGFGTTYNLPGPSIADFDAGGAAEVLWTTRDWWAQGARLWSFNVYQVDGIPLPGFPQEAPDLPSNALNTAFVLGDVDNSGGLEAWGAHSYGSATNASRISAFNSEGDLVQTIDLDPSEDIRSLHFGDLDGDGAGEFFAVSWLSPAYRLHVFERDGGAAPDYPVNLETTESGTPLLGPSIPADLDADGDLEILIGYWENDSVVQCRHHDGTQCAGFPLQIASNSQLLYLALGDISGTQTPELIAIERRFGGPSRVFAIDLATGSVLPGWPISFASSPKGLPAIADVTGDGSQEVCLTTSAGEVWALAQDGGVVSGFPKQMVSPSLSGVAIGDIDNDGLVELVAATWNGWVYAWDTMGVDRPSTMDWPMRGVDPRNTGVFGNQAGLIFADDFESADTSAWLPAGN